MRAIDPQRLGFGAFLCAHRIAVAFCVLCCAFAWPLLGAMGLGASERLLLEILLATVFVVLQAGAWARERAWMQEARRIAAGGKDALALAADTPDLDGLEGEAFTAAVRAVSAQAAREAGCARAAQADYRDFVETWVHEVKTPLAAANLFVENANDPSLRPLSRELSRVEAFVEQALFYARSSSVENDYLLRTCALGPLVAEAVKLRATQLIEAHVAVDMTGLSCADGTDVTAPCDAKWLTFIVGQLIDNAVRYRSDPVRDGRTPRIAFSATEEALGTADERVVLAVHDNGCGIPAADLPRVCERGFTGSNGRARQRSTGMGLYLVDTLCRKMGLAVLVDSQEGAWTEVRIVLPRNRFREGLDPAKGQSVPRVTKA
ncbi:sensor histidine kinase [Hugonella massiliensis]|uniref:sensor histidine kinase n=1 Tax=Hugonella massiliensis TaxID=1720315 RepID=UPI00073FA2C3|nr:sensor histidine kinase [Hugonella massiliensis]